MATQPTITEVENALKNPNLASLQGSDLRDFEPAKFDTTKLLSNPSNTLNLNQIQPLQPLNFAGTFPTGTGATAADPDAMVAGTKSYQDYFNELTATKTDSQLKADTLTSSIDALLPQTAGKAEALAAKETELGIPDQQKQLASLNSQILSRAAEYEKMRTDTEANSNFKGSFSAKDLQITRTKAADVGLLQARALGLRGEIEAAKDIAERAIDLKYAGIEDQISIKMRQLQLLQPSLDADERKQATALQRKYEDEKQAVAEKKAKQKENMVMAFTANVKTPLVNKNGEFFRTGDGEAFERPEDLFKAFGVRSFGELYQKGLVTDLDATRIADMDFAAQARAKYPDAGINPMDDPEIVQQKLQGSRLYRKDSYIAPPAGTNDIGNGIYSAQQLKAITALNEKISKSDVYKKTTAMRVFVDNVTGALQQGNGISDIAAINQFQKVIDEGAVTRDQDVKLIQQSQSLANSLKLKIKRLEKGDQLSSDQRQQMRSLVESLYSTQTKALMNDPYIKAKTTEAGLYGLTGSDTIIGELGGFQEEVSAEEFTKQAEAAGYTQEEINAYLKSKGLQ